MKKLALIIALVLVACFAFVACSPANEGETSTPTTSSQEGNNGSQGQQTPDSQAPTSSQGTTVTPPPAGGEVWMDFSTIATGKTKGTEYTETATVGGVVFNINRGKFQTSSGKTVKEGTKTGTKFTVGFQVGKNGSATEKAIYFTVPAGMTSVEFYVNSASSGTDGDFNVSVNGTATSYPCVNANITAVTVTVTEGATVAVYGGAAVSTNVWGILVK